MMQWSYEFKMFFHSYLVKDCWNLYKRDATAYTTYTATAAVTAGAIVDLFCLKKYLAINNL